MDCSPEDQAILEVEYEKNCKPDKAARSEIVKRVTLGEKEVQVSGTVIPRSSLASTYLNPSLSVDRHRPRLDMADRSTDMVPKSSSGNAPEISTLHHTS